MENSLFFNHIEENEYNKDILEKFEEYSNENPNEQLYLITAPLSEKKYQYEYEKNVIVVLSPKHKILFLDLCGQEAEFQEYCEDFIEDLSSLSDKYNYKQHIGRPREWKSELISRKNEIPVNLYDLLKSNEVTNSNLKRKIELLISLLIGSINDVEEIGVDVPETILEKVKKILFFLTETKQDLYIKTFLKK